MGGYTERRALKYTFIASHLFGLPGSAWLSFTSCPLTRLGKKCIRPLQRTQLSFFALFIICATYIKIRSHLKHSPRIFDYNQRRNMERHIKLSKTLFTVIAVSFACWFPAVIVYIVIDFCFKCLPKDVMWIGTFVHLSNSAVNPIAYSCRMPSFRKTVNRLLKKQQPENVQLAQL